MNRFLILCAKRIADGFSADGYTALMKLFLILFAFLLSAAPCLADPPQGVTFRDDQTILVRGEPFFPIGLYYCQEELDDPTGQGMKELREAGFNTMGYYRWNSPDWKQELDLAHDNGLMVWYRGVDGFAITDDAGEGRVVEQLRTYRDHPSLLMWEFQDEPILNQVPVDQARRGQALVRREDPHHPILVCHWPGAADRFESWKDLGDIVMTDLYPIPREKGYGRLPNKDITQMRDYLERLREAHGDKPRMLVLQAWSWDPLKYGERGYPTVAESRFMAYQAVLHGAKGLLYYGQYRCTKPNSAAALWSQAEDPTVREREFQRCLELNGKFWKEHRPFFKELEQASKIFVLREADPATAVSVAPADGSNAITVSTRQSGDRLYALAINASPTAGQFKLILPSAWKDAKLTVLFEDRTVQVKNGKLIDQFKPYDVHVYSSAK
ncbi:MAG: hypothetical protein AB7O62_07990 [Pirellulales bacterium]